MCGYLSRHSTLCTGTRLAGVQKLTERSVSTAIHHSGRNERLTLANEIPDNFSLRNANKHWRTSTRRRRIVTRSTSNQHCNANDEISSLRRVSMFARTLKCEIPDGPHTKQGDVVRVRRAPDDWLELRAPTECLVKRPQLNATPVRRYFGASCLAAQWRCQLHARAFWSNCSFSKALSSVKSSPSFFSLFYFFSLVAGKADDSKKNFFFSSCIFYSDLIFKKK